jgi:putative membrane protein
MPHVHPAAAEWTKFPVPLTLILVLTALVYLRGWLRARSTSFNGIRAWRAASFLLGLFSIWVAVGSPIAELDHEYLTVHMIQHLLLMTFAAPLIWLGAPAMALLNGLPQRVVQGIVDPLVRWRPVSRLGRALTQPAFCWIAATTALVVWHVPAVLTFGMQSEAWHIVEQASFFATGLLFWWPVVQLVQPWPSVSRWPVWSMILYLFLATLPCDILSGFLVFSDRIAYPVYLTASRQSGLSVLADQQCAGALMWTSVTIVYVVAGAILSTRLLSPQGDLQIMEVR